MAKENPRSDGEYLNTRARGLSVLRSFTKDRPETSLSEVAAATALSPAVARRCLNTLDPHTLACMHGSAYQGDGAMLLRELANRLAA